MNQLGEQRFPQRQNTLKTFIVVGLMFFFYNMLLHDSNGSSRSSSGRTITKGLEENISYSQSHVSFWLLFRSSHYKYDVEDLQPLPLLSLPILRWHEIVRKKHYIVADGIHATGVGVQSCAFMFHGFAYRGIDLGFCKILQLFCGIQLDFFKN